MALLMAGVSHKTASLELREALALETRAEECERALKACGFDEWIWLSTCNRVEVYASTGESAAAGRLTEFFAGLAPTRGPQIAKALHVAADDEALWHLLKVACSLDSMVVGEAQILGQVKRAYERGVRSGSVGPVFHGVFQRVFAAAKMVRSETAVGRTPAGIPGVAAQTAARIFGDLAGRKVLVVGAGETAERTAEHLEAAGANSFTFCNRSLPKARELARRHRGKAVELDALDTVLVEAELVVASVLCQSPLIKASALRAAQKHRKHRRLLLDLGVPRNIEAAAGDVDQVVLRDLDALESEASAHRVERERAAREAESILRHRMRELRDHLAAARVTPTIRRLGERFEEVRASETAKARRRKLARLDEKDFREVEALSRALVAKLLHAPLDRLKRGAAGDPKDLAPLVRGVEELFRLDKKEGA
jgi:glutamyl-tRNA reductase